MAKQMGRAQTTALCRLQSRPLRATGAIRATLRTLQRKGFAKHAYKVRTTNRGRATQYLKITSRGRRKAANVCG